ncbi:MAG: DUF1622 domain-containing protein [Polyangiaceae bacterium]|nr:DUF1622 domain-containing protein [Polyangiaceae bacterium]
MNLGLAAPLFPPPEGGAVEETVVAAVQWLRLAVELVGAAVVLAGLVAVGRVLVRGALARTGARTYSDARLTLARFLALALEFQLGADILSTAVAPSWDQIGKLGAIAIIRTALNYFLRREMHEA